MGHRTWIKIYCDKWLEGTLRQESSELRGVWVDVLTLAGNSNYGDTGEIKIVNNIGLPDETIAEVFKIDPNKWQEYKQRLIETERIIVSDNNVISICNWEKYQSEYDRTKRYRTKSTTNDTENDTWEKEIEKEKEKENIYTRARERVFLTKEKYQSLLKAYPEDRLNWMLDKLDFHLSTTSRKYKGKTADGFFKAGSWLIEEMEKHFTGQKPQRNLSAEIQQEQDGLTEEQRAKNRERIKQLAKNIGKGKG